MPRLTKPATGARPTGGEIIKAAFANAEAPLSLGAELADFGFDSVEVVTEGGAPALIATLPCADIAEAELRALGFKLEADLRSSLEE